MSPRLLALPFLALLLAGCDIPGMEPDPRIAQREADAKATGGACRYGLRGLEDCYSLNPKASKAAVFDGWKEMDQYMRDNKIAGQASSMAQAPPVQPQVDAEASLDKDTEKVVSPRKSKARAAPL
jgi:hypothetical protein